jgi:glyoxylase-like metal-dependent hydrolase (beta-lactamase superfamily II)
VTDRERDSRYNTCHHLRKRPASKAVAQAVGDVRGARRGQCPGRALARWIELHHRNLTTIYVTHMHIDHYGGLSVLLRHFPDARAIATPKSVELMPKQPEELAVYRKFLPELPTATTPATPGAR